MMRMWGPSRRLGLNRHSGARRMPCSVSRCASAMLLGLPVSTQPKTPAGEKKAALQLDSYKGGLKNWYKQDRATLMSKYPKLAECEHGEGDTRDLSLDTMPEFYDFCPSSNDEVGDSFDPQEGDVDTELQR